jgi:hypothetical protein
VLRDAIIMYGDNVDANKKGPHRTFGMTRVAEGPGGSIADIREEELLKGFGE